MATSSASQITFARLLELVLLHIGCYISLLMRIHRPNGIISNQKKLFWRVSVGLIDAALGQIETSSAALEGGRNYSGLSCPDHGNNEEDMMR